MVIFTGILDDSSYDYWVREAVTANIPSMDDAGVVKVEGRLGWVCL